MITVNMQPTIDIHDALEELDLHSVADFNFSDECNNGDYTYFGLDDDALQDLNDNIEHAQEKLTRIKLITDATDYYWQRRLSRLTNDLRLLNKLREQGWDNGMLVQVWW